jgi:hypothetical protein
MAGEQEARRLKLHDLLVAITPVVYYKAPTNTTMTYPCIVYKRDRVDTRFADNIPFFRKKRYQLTVIDTDPDSDIPDKVGELPMCTHDRTFTADSLNHDVFNIYF